MVKNILRFLYKEIGSLHQAAYLLALFAVLSQGLALFRDRLLAHTFGASQAIDIYYAAFRIPDFIFIAIGSIVSISVLVPFLAERIETNLEEAGEFIDHVFTFFFGMVVVVSIGIFFALPFLIKIVFPGFVGHAYVELVILSRILLLSPILLGISNIFGSITQIHRRFFVYAMSPVFYNVGIIVGIMFLAPMWGIYGVVAGVVLGALLHGLIQVPFVIKTGLFPRLRIHLDWALMRKVFVLSFPRTITLGSTHVMILIFLGTASAMTEGSIAVFNFSYNLQSVPLAIVGVSYSLAAFPTLSQLFVGHKRKKFINYIVTAARHIIFWTLPISIMFIVLRAQIVRTILGSGQFDWDATRLTSAGLAIFCLSIIFQSLILLFVRGYYSAGVTTKPLIISLVSAVLGVVSGWVFVRLYAEVDMFRFFVESILRVEDIVGAEVLMLILAFTLAQSINALALMFLFQKDFGDIYRPLGTTFIHSLSSGVIAGAVAWFFLRLLDDVFPLEVTWGIFLQGFIAGSIGIVVGIFILYIVGNKELKEVWNALHRKLWRKTDIVGPDPDIA